MLSPSRPAWQFSLKTLLLAFLACAVLAGAAKWLGASIFVPVILVLLAAAPLIVMRRPLVDSYLMSCSAIYGPFLAMATYTLLFIDCSHCKQTAWQTLPCAPGLVATHLGVGVLGLPRPYGVLETLIPAVAAAVLVAVMTGLTHIGGRWWKAALLTVVAGVCSFFAMALLAAIRA
jgi:hypothetical protein